MNCTKSVTMTVVGGSACDSVPNAPTPSSLLDSTPVDLGNMTVVTPNLGTIAQNTWAPNIPIGQYKVNFVSGHSNAYNPDYGTICLPTGLDASETHCGDDSAIDTRMEMFGMVLGFGGTVAGSNGHTCGPVNLVNAAALEASTLAMNPVATGVVVKSGAGGTGPLYQIDGLVPVGIKITCTASGSGQIFKGGSITWDLVRYESVFTQPVRVRIKDYATVKTTFPTCVSCLTPDEWANPNPSVAIEWDGTFPYGFIVYPGSNDGMVNYNATDIHSSTFANFDECLLMLNGKALATTLDYETRIKYRVVSGVGFWELAIICYGGGYIENIWYGKKFTGSTAEGLYSISLGDSCVTGPDSLCVESY